MMYSVSHKYRFTLIELMVVVAIIGILMTMLIPSLKKARDATKKAVCVNNLKQAGIAVYNYAADQNDIINVNVYMNTFSARQVWADSTYQGNFFNDEHGYLDIYLGSNEAAYTCPGSEHVADLGNRPAFTKIPGTYIGFTDYNYSARSIDQNWVVNPNFDSFHGWDSYNMTPLAMDPVIDMTIWGDTWVNTASVIHGNKGSLPVLILDGRVHQFHRSKYPALWPSSPWNYNYIMEDLLRQIN